MKKNLTRLLSILLALVLTVGMLPVSALADGWRLSGSLERGEIAGMAESIGTQAAAADKYRIVHLDCGRKYFSVENIKKLIDTMAQYGYNQLELAFANDGCRFLLDAENLELTYQDASGKTITRDGTTVRNALKAGLVAYTGSNSYTNDDNRYLEEADVTEILAYAAAKNIEIVPLINMPGHAKALTYSFGYGTSKDYSVNLSSTEATNYALALLQKYVDWFKGKVNYFSFGADEYNGFTHDHDTVDAFVKSCTKIIKDAGMTPRAFNDSICYEQNTGCGPDTNTGIQLCHWGQGWSGYYTSKASTLKAKGYNLINTNGNWYYVLKTYDNGNSTSYYLDPDRQFSVELPTKKNYKCGVDTYAMQGGSETVTGGLGTMFCIWCDQFDAIAQDEVISDLEYGALPQIKALAEYYWPEDINKGGEETDPVVSTEDGSEVPSTVTVDKPLILTADKVVKWTTSDSAVLDIEENAGASTNGVAALAAEKTVTAKSVKVTPRAPGTATITAADLSDSTKSVEYSITAQAAETGTTKPITVTVNGTATDTIENLTEDIRNGSYTVEPAGYADVTVTTKQVPGKTTYQPVTSLTDGTFYVAGAGETATDTLSWKFTKISGNTYYIQDSNGNYIYPNATYSWRSGWSYSASNNSTRTTVNITGNGNGTIKVYKDFSSNWGGNTTAYLTLSNGSANASGTSSSISVYQKVTQPAGYTATVEFKGLKVTEGVVPTVTIGGVTYNITVVPEDLKNAEKQNVELWITNRELTDTNGNHTVSLDASTYYGQEGAALTKGAVPEQIEVNGTTYVFWKGVVLHNGQKQYNNNNDDDKADKSGSGTNFYKMRYLGGKWQYLAASGENAGSWVDVAGDDTLIAYYLQKFTVSDEITTLTRDYGDAPNNNQPNIYWAEAYTATGFAVVRPGNVINRTDDEIYANLMLRGWMSNVDYDGFGPGKQSVGIIYAENNSDFEVEKITIVKGTNATNTWPKATGDNNTVTWARKTNEAGDTWFDETTVWSADDPETYGTTPILNGLGNEKYCFDENNKCFLILIYLRTVEKQTNLNFRYVDRTDDSVIYSSQISMKYTLNDPEPTYTDTLKDGDGIVIGGTKDWPGKTAGAANYLPDSAYVTNSAGQKQNFNKRISTFPGIDAKYRTGLYVYDGAEISEDGKMLTLYYNIDSSKLDATYVVDFGLPLDIPLSDLINNWSSVTGVAVNGTALDKTPLPTDHGQLTYDAASKTITYTLTKAFDTPMVSATFKLTLEDNTFVSITIGVIPASNVLYEENFLTREYAKDTDVEWTTDGSAPTAAQETQKLNDDSDKTYHVFGTDAAYSEKLGKSGVWAATGLTTKTRTGMLTTTFYGNAFDLIGSCGKNTGRILLMFKPVSSKTAKSKAYIIDTRYNDGEIDIDQVPFVHAELSEETTYNVEVYASGLAATTAASSAAAAMAMPRAVTGGNSDPLLSVVRENGLSVSDVEYISLESNTAASAAVSSIGTASKAAAFAAPQTVSLQEGTHVEIDGFRVYRSSDPSAENSIANNYPEEERNITYKNILDVVQGEILAYREGDNGDSKPVAVKNYEATGGPLDEIYLANGQAISFGINDPAVTSIQISLRAVKNSASWATSENGISSDLKTNTEMYYTVQRDANNLFTIVNCGNELLAIGNVKLPSSVKTEDITSASEIDEQVLLQSLRAAFGASEVEPEPEVFEPDTFDANVSTLRLLRSKLVTIRISVSSDVSYVTVNGEKYWPGRTFSWQRSRSIQFRDTIGRNQSKTYTIIAYDANGVASAPITVNG